MVKVSCNCTSYGCDGKEVDRRTHQSHALKDRTARGLQKATEAAGHVIQDQLDTITHHLATTTLSDVASRPEPPILLSSSIDSQLDSITHHLATTSLSDAAPSTEPLILPSFGFSSPPAMRSSSQARTHRLLKRLSEIEVSVNALDAEVTMQLCRSGLPSFLDSQSFPLVSHVGKCRILDADLVKVTSKSAAVTAAKDTIKNQLDVIARKLQAAKKTWIEKQEVTCQRRPAECTTQYSTGQSTLSHTTHFLYLKIIL